jgi:hypothetical protein
MGKNIYLYHGSDQDVVDPKCDHGFKGHDFGQCFYTTYSRATAKNWAAKRFEGKGVVNKYHIDLERLTDGNLKIKRFNADAEWAEFVWNNRFVKKFKRPDYDIIIGPIADFGLKKEFLRMKTEGLSFSEVASRIHYDKYRSLQVSFCTPYSLTVLNKL